MMTDKHFNFEEIVHEIVLKIVLEIVSISVYLCHFSDHDEYDNAQDT